MSEIRLKKKAGYGILKKRPFREELDMKFSAVKRFSTGWEEPVRLDTEEKNGVTAVRPVTDVEGGRDLTPLDPECGVRISIDPQKEVR